MAVEILAALGFGLIAGILMRHFFKDERVEGFSPIPLETSILALVLAAGVELGSRLNSSQIELYDLLYYSLVPGLLSIIVFMLARRAHK